MQAQGLISDIDAPAETTQTKLRATDAHPRRTFVGKMILATIGLSLFAAMGYLAATFVIDMHIKLPWYFPH